MINLLVIALAVSAVEITSAEPKCHMVEVGKCVDFVANYINKLPRRTIPTTSEDMAEMCDEISNAFDCWDDFKKRCMTPIQTELEALVVEGVRDLKDKFCTPGSDLSIRFLKHSQCLSDGLRSDIGTSNINRIIATFEKFDAVPDSKKIRYTCCGWNTMFDTIKSAYIGLCGEEATKAAEDLLAIAVSNLPNVLCQGFDSTSDECTKLLPPVGATPAGKHNPFVDGLRYVFKNHID